TRNSQPSRSVVPSDGSRIGSERRNRLPTGASGQPGTSVSSRQRPRMSRFGSVFKQASFQREAHPRQAARLLGRDDDRCLALRTEYGPKRRSTELPLQCAKHLLGGILLALDDALEPHKPARAFVIAF